MKKQLRKPENWQDFENLCKILWGEIWQCSEIKKNGRIGQSQHGVDIYGIPKDENQYYGIQCKGKDDYSQSVLSQTEIDKELVKAMMFKPKLKKIYFATTANKDSVIEEYIRVKDIEFRENNHFEIHLFSWEDIVDLIDQNKKTSDWYIHNIGFRSGHSVDVLFHNNLSEISFKPKLYKNFVNYKLKESVEQKHRPYLGILPYNYNDSNEEDETLLDPQPIRYYFTGGLKNKSSCVFSLSIKNIGLSVIENFKLYFSLKSNNVIVDTVNKHTDFLDTISTKYKYYITYDKHLAKYVFDPDEKILVQSDTIFTEQMCFRPTIEDAESIILEYEFVAKDFNKKGELSINVESIIKIKHSTEERAFFKEDEIRLENYY
jgi:hypothetical protein